MWKIWLNVIKSFPPLANFWAPPPRQFRDSPDFDRLKLHFHVKPEKESLLRESRPNILWHGRLKPVAKLFEATLIKRRDINFLKSGTLNWEYLFR
jgi:hypothetical protein